MCKGKLDMTLRFILGFVLTVALSACGSGISTSGSSGAVSGSIASTTPDATTSQIILSGDPAGSVIVGSAYSFTPTVAASGIVTFVVSGLPTWASFDSSTGTLSGTPSGTDVGTTGDITITATDGASAGSIGPFVIRVEASAPVATNTAPVISGTPSTGIVSGQTYEFRPTATDAEGQPLTFAITNRPAWASFSTETGELTGKPTAAQAGSYKSIIIRVTDGTSSASLPAFTIVVTAAGQDTPVISGTPAANALVGQAYSFQPTAKDPAGKALTFSIKNPPAWAAFSMTTGKLSGTPTAAQVGSYPGIVISADNGTQMVSLPAFKITVSAAAATDSPSISGSPPIKISTGQAYGFTPTAHDPAGKTLTFSIVNRPTWATFSTTNGTLSGTPNSAQAGSYPGIAISVTNGSASATLPVFNITVSSATPAGSPTISGSPATTVAAGSTYNFVPTHTDPSGGTLVFSIHNAPSWATFNTTTGQLTGTPSAANVGTTSGIVISVSDGKSSATLPGFSVAVTQAPTTTATGSATLSWSAPKTNTNGTPLTDLSGYQIYYGNNANATGQSVKIANPSAITYTISGLAPGTWYFKIAAYNSLNVDSSAVGTVSKTID
jgi:hypothetical protein